MELKETQALCQTLQGCREALDAMRYHAADVYPHFDVTHAQSDKEATDNHLAAPHFAQLSTMQLSTPYQFQACPL